MANIGNQVAVLAVSTLSLSAPLALAACGGFTSERSGVINIALEGNMLASAGVTAVMTLASHSVLIGVSAGVGSAIFLALVHWLLTQIFCVDHVVSGIAINLFALGATNFIDTKYSDILSSEAMPRLFRMNVDFFGQHTYVNPYIALAYILPFALTLWAVTSRGGLRLFAVGNDPDKARLAGIKVIWLRLFAQIATGIFSGLSGALIVDNAGHFTNNMTAGRGYIALAALIMGGWRPIPAFLACLAFGAFEALQIALQGVAIGGITIPVQVWQSAPYVLGIIVLAGAFGQTRPPYGLGKP